MEDPRLDDGAMRYPHCDSNVLHKPGACRWCDHYPERQAARSAQGINFTGVHEEGKELCPSELRRPVSTINLWPGNRTLSPTTEEEKPCL